MAYVRNNHGNYGGLGRVWGLGSAAPTPSTSGATAVAAGSGVIATPQEPTKTYYPGFPGYPGMPGYGMPGYGMPGYGMPGYPGYPMTTVPTVMSAPAALATSSDHVAVMRLPTFVAEDKRRMFRKPRIRPQLARLGAVAAVIGLGLLAS